MNRFLFMLIIGLISTSNTTQAQETTSGLPVKLLVEAGIEFGGDEILEVFFTNGGDQTIDAGQGGFISVGAQFHIPTIKSIMLRTSIGLKYVTTAAEDANIRFIRYPINFMGYYVAKNDLRIGAGITAHQGVSFKGDNFVPDVDFTSPIGGRFEIGWKWIALTYSAVNYVSEMDEDVSGSSVGVAVSFTLPNAK